MSDMTESRSTLLLTLEETLNHQEDLDSLCQDRSLVTPEKFPPNDFYGMASILKMYASLPNNYPLNVVVPHGLSLSLDFAWSSEIQAPVPSIFYHSKHVKRAYLKNIQQSSDLSRKDLVNNCKFFELNLNLELCKLLHP